MQGRVTFQIICKSSRNRISAELDLSLLLHTMVRPQSSAAGVLALLQEPDPIFKQHALKSLNSIVPQFWAEISEQIASMYVYHCIDPTHTHYV